MPRDFAQLSCLPSLDAEYRFDRPKVYLTSRELARLTIVRSRLGDTRADRETEPIPSSRRPARHSARSLGDLTSGQILT